MVHFFFSGSDDTLSHLEKRLNLCRQSLTNNILGTYVFFFLFNQFVKHRDLMCTERVDYDVSLQTFWLQ